MLKKYELTDETITLPNGSTCFRIRALQDFSLIQTGDLGGYIENAHNLSQEGRCWVSGRATVSADARVFGDAEVSDNAEVYGNAWVFGNADVSGSARVAGDTDYFTVQSIGSRNSTLTFYRTETGIGVCCGCFRGTLDEFAEAVERKHGDNEHGQSYRLLIEAAKLRIKSANKTKLE